MVPLQRYRHVDTTGVAIPHISPQQDETKKLNCNIMKKNVIRLTEGDLHRIIKESVNAILNERIKSEKGMSDDEVRYRRNKHFSDEMDKPRTVFDKYNDMPSVSDIDPYFAERDGGVDNYLHRKRLEKHGASQNHDKYYQYKNPW